MCSTIMNLLSLANEDSVPGADDFVPVLVFVLIRVSLFFILHHNQIFIHFTASIDPLLIILFKNTNWELWENISLNDFKAP